MDFKFDELVKIDKKINSIFYRVIKKSFDKMNMLDYLNVAIIVKLRTIIKKTENTDDRLITVDGVSISDIISNLNLGSFDNIKKLSGIEHKYALIMFIVGRYKHYQFNLKIYSVLNEFIPTIHSLEKMIQNMDIFEIMDLENDKSNLEDFLNEAFKKSCYNDYFNNFELVKMITDDDALMDNLPINLFTKYYFILKEFKDVSYLDLYFELEIPRDRCICSFLEKFSQGFDNFIKIDIKSPNINDYCDHDLLGDIQNKLMIESALIIAIIKKMYLVNSDNDLVINKIDNMNKRIIDKQIKILEFLSFIRDICEKK